MSIFNSFVHDLSGGDGLSTESLGRTTEASEWTVLIISDYLQRTLFENTIVIATFYRFFIECEEMRIERKRKLLRVPI